MRVLPEVEPVFVWHRNWQGKEKVRALPCFPPVSIRPIDTLPKPGFYWTLQEVLDSDKLSDIHEEAKTLDEGQLIERTWEGPFEHVGASAVLFKRLWLDEVKAINAVVQRRLDLVSATEACRVAVKEAESEVEQAQKAYIKAYSAFRSGPHADLYV